MLIKMTSIPNMRPIRKTANRIGVILIVCIPISLVWYFQQVRSKYYARVSVTEAVKFSDKVARAIDMYRSMHHKFPSSLSEITLPKGEPGYIPGVKLEPITGTLTVSVVSEEGAYGVLKFVPNQSPSEWRCENVSVSKEFLPPQCIS